MCRFQILHAGSLCILFRDGQEKPKVATVVSLIQSTLLWWNSHDEHVIVITKLLTIKFSLVNSFCEFVGYYFFNKSFVVEK